MLFRNFGILLLVLASIIVSACTSESEPVMVKNEKGESREVAIDGFDAVAYFAAEKATKGVPQFRAVHEGVDWFFSSAENKEKFEKSPELYGPEFGAFCPVSLSRGTRINGKPTVWRVVNEKLYFFYSEDYAKEFDKDSEGILKKAKENEKKE